MEIMETTEKTHWEIDKSHTNMAFKVKHMMISTVTGEFESFTGQIESEGEDFKNSNIYVSIDVDSISTKDSDRATHLKSDDFFNAEKFPQILFKSSFLVVNYFFSSRLPVSNHKA